MSYQDFILYGGDKIKRKYTEEKKENKRKKQDKKEIKDSQHSKVVLLLVL